MTDWPRTIHGHTVAREVDFLRGGGGGEERVVHRYQCIRCGLQVEDEDDLRLAESQCIRTARNWME